MSMKHTKADKWEWINIKDDVPDEDEFVLIAWLPKDRRRMPDTYKHFWALTTYDYIEDEGCEFDCGFLEGTGYKKYEVDIVAWASLPEENEVEDDKH